MQRFILQENIARYYKLLEGETRADARVTLASLLAAAERDLALLNATEIGVGASAPPSASAECRAEREAPARDPGAD